jgi:hypothetical protein
VITGNLVEVEPKFCRRCGHLLSSEATDRQDPEGGYEDDEEFSLYNFNDLEEIVKGIVPENYKDLTPDQLERYAVQSIWKRVTGIDPYPKIDTRERDAEHERQMQIAHLAVRIKHGSLVMMLASGLKGSSNSNTARRE